MSKIQMTPLRWIIFGSLVCIGGLTVWTMLHFQSQTGKIRIEIVAVPKDATVKLNGKTVSQSTYIRPGHYTVTGEKTGFVTNNYQLDIIDQNQKVFVLLSPSSTDAKTWVEKNQNAYLEIQDQVDKQVLSTTKSFIEKNPIIARLPYENYLYKISYRVDPADKSGQSIIITIDAPEQYRSAAIEKISSLGYDPSAYTYEYTNFTNVFKEVR